MPLPAGTRVGKTMILHCVKYRSKTQQITHPCKQMQTGNDRTDEYRIIINNNFNYELFSWQAPLWRKEKNMFFPQKASLKSKVLVA